MPRMPRMGWRQRKSPLRRFLQPYRCTCSLGLGSTWCWQAPSNQTARVQPAFPSVISPAGWSSTQLTASAQCTISSNQCTDFVTASCTGAPSFSVIF
jgi:hypothetical protein